MVWTAGCGHGTGEQTWPVSRGMGLEELLAGGSTTKGLEGGASVRLELEYSQLTLKYAALRILDAAGQARLMASLAEHGQMSAVLVIEAEEGQYVLIDGYRRIEGLKKLGTDTVVAVVLPMGEVEALLFGHQHQRGRKTSILEEGWLLMELRDMYGISLEEMAVKLARSKSWVSRRLGLVKELPDPVQELVRAGAICAYAAMKYLLPLARANRASCIRIAEGIGAGRLSARQVETLYIAWKRAEDSERERIVEHPLMCLKAAEEIARPLIVDPEEGVEQETCKDLAILRNVSHRLRRRLEEAKDDICSSRVLKRVVPRWHETRLAFEGLAEVIEEIAHAQHRLTHNDLTPP